MFRGGDYVEVDPTGRYGRFEDVLGRGAMKTVYRAFDELHGLEVAWNWAKLSDVLRSPEALERLYSEVHLLSTLSHDSIIRFHTSWVDSEKRTFNFITEMFTSGTLREYRQRYKHVDVGAVKNWARQILHGLVYLHGHDPPVIHRDLKCDNIFVNGNLGLVKIGDLGLAAVLRDSQPARSVIGTPEFMAPELYDEEYNELVDVYSFGMCFLEMLTAEYPYSECSNPAQIFKKVTSGKLPAAFYKIQNQEARRFIGRCLEVASKRPSAQEILLDPFLQPGSSDPPSTSSRTASQSQFFSPNPLIHRPMPIRCTDMRITGRMNPDDDSITLWVQMVDIHGDPRNIYFPFDIVSDTAVDVANEMVKELEINDRDPSQIANVIDQEISALVPNWKERSPGDNQLHVYNYVDTNDETPHPFFYQSSPTSSQGSYFSQPPPQNSQINHSRSTSQANEWFQDNGTTHDGDDDDTNSQSSMYSGNYSYVNYNSGSEHDPESSSQRRDAQRIHNKNKSSRFSPELLNEKFQKQCKVLPECSQQSASHGTRRSSDNHQLMRNRSLVDIRSQLLHQALVEQVNKRMFKTVGAVEDIGYQNPCETSGKKKKSYHGFAKNLGLTWGK